MWFMKGIKNIFFKLVVDEFIRNDLKKNKPPPPPCLSGTTNPLSASERTASLRALDNKAEAFELLAHTGLYYPVFL